MEKIKVRGVYMHHKTKNLYRVLDLAQLESNLTQMVIYQGLYGERKKWIRPIDEFLENVPYEGKLVPRFKFVE
jgi:hypothetical protein